MKWAIGDVHGCLIQLVELLRAIEFRASHDQIIFLGDLVDFGEYSKAVFDLVRDGEEQGCFRVVRGIHEHEWARVIRQGLEQEHADMYPETWHSFNGRDGILELVNWVESLPYFVETSSAVLVHGGMRSDRHFKMQDEYDLLYTRNDAFIPGEFRDNKWVIHGHSPVIDPIVQFDRINIDTGCVFGGKLTAFNLDALENGKLEFASVDGLLKRDDTNQERRFPK